MTVSRATARIKMATKELYVFWQLVIFWMIVALPGAAAFDGGDAAALILGLIIGTLGICACLGAYARRRSGNA